MGVPPRSEIECANPECRKLLTVAAWRAGRLYCSGACAENDRSETVEGHDAIRIRDGDRWEKRAPQMRYTDAMRTAEIFQIMEEERNRR